MWYLILPVLLIAIFLYINRQKQFSGRSRRLRRDIRQKMRLSPKNADEIIDDYLSRLRQKHPDKQEEWYLEKMLYELERDK